MNKAIIFDMDGLLLDSERPVRDAWFTVTKQRGFKLEDAIFNQLIGRNMKDGGKVILDHFGEGFPYAHVCKEVDDLLHSRLKDVGYSLKAGVLDLLNELQSRGIVMGVATSTSTAKAMARLKSVSIDHYFHAVSCGDEVLRGKPEPDLFLLAAQKLKALPKNCLVLEDSMYGARGAHRAGMKVIVVPDLISPPDDVHGFAMGIYASMFDAKSAVLQWIE